MYRGTTVDPPTPSTFPNALTQVEVTRVKYSCLCQWDDTTGEHIEISLLHLNQWETLASVPLTYPSTPWVLWGSSPTVNKHKSCRWYEPLVCVVGTTSNIFKIKVPLHKVWLTTGMCCILFFKKNKKTSQKKKKRWLKKSQMFVLQCSN